VNKREAKIEALLISKAEVRALLETGGASYLIDGLDRVKVNRELEAIADQLERRAHRLLQGGNNG